MSTKQVGRKERKRVVLSHATGRLAGLSQILGVVEAENAEVTAADYPPSLHYGTASRQTAHHERTRTRYINYREWAQAPVGRLNDFNPSQV